MANSIGNEQQPSRPPIRLLGSVLLLGTLLAWWGTRDHRRLFGESAREPFAAANLLVPQGTPENRALPDRGFQVSERQCAGCHEMTTGSSGPSYQEIVTFYRHKFPASASNQNLRSRLASAVTHPQPGWGNFTPGPSESGLSLDDRVAIASWMLNSFDPDKNAGEGVRK